ncbi:MAG: methyltransferase domain-containing protein [Thermodesulfovibrionales bacterium]|jgi:SAM-dependent methyltransferase
MADELNIAGIQKAVRGKYAEVSETAEGKFSYPTGRDGAVLQGYDPTIIDSMPAGAIASFCGVGNPFALGSINSGETLLDVGCGAGFDLIVASRLVGQKGKVCGIDITPEMSEQARRNLTQVGMANFDVQVAGAESIPYHDNFFDIVISNGVLNLSPLKEKSFMEIYRVLKPSGRFQFSDIVLKSDVSLSGGNSLEAWSN